MAAPWPLIVAQVRALASPESFDRGREYFQSGAVEGLVLRGERLEAEVAGSEFEPYRVAVTLGPTGVVAESCTCPYDWGGACKHVVATLLAYLDEPEAVEERPPLAAVLAALDHEQLQRIVLSLAQDDPALTARIELQVATLAAGTPAGSAGSRRGQAPPAVEPANLRRQVRAAIDALARLRSSEAYRHIGETVGQIVQVAEQARPFFEAGDVPTALTILEAVTTEYLDVWMELDGSSGESGAAFYELAALWAEAFLSGELTAAERDHWENRFADWQATLADYGVDDPFLLAETAMEEGWDDADLARTLRQNATPAGFGSLTPPSALIDIRLRVLARQSRNDEYLC